MLEEVHHWGRALKVHSFAHFLRALSAFCVQLICDLSASCSSCPRCHASPGIMDLLNLQSHKVYFFFLSVFSHGILPQQQRESGGVTNTGELPNMKGGSSDLPSPARILKLSCIHS